MAESDSDRVIAIDVLLLPDATMVDHAKEANARLLKNYSKGYTLGETKPHMSRWSTAMSTRKTWRKSKRPSQKKFPNKPARSTGNSPRTVTVTVSGPV